MPFNDEAQELLRQAAAIEAAPLEAPGAARGAGEGGTSAVGQAGQHGAGVPRASQQGEHGHERKGHPERSFPQ